MRKKSRSRTPWGLPLALTLLGVAAGMAGCQWDSSLYDEFVVDGNVSPCGNDENNPNGLTAIYLPNGEIVTRETPSYYDQEQNLKIDYTNAFTYNICPKIANTCVETSDGSICTPCSKGQRLCYNECVDYDATHIIACKNNDNKTIECKNEDNNRWADCDGNIKTGCEYEFTEAKHAKFCVYNEELNKSMVTCASDDYTDCDGDYNNGCEYQLSTNGAVNCDNKKVTCDTDHADCDGSYLTGCEIDITTNNKHCGACGNVCKQGTICSGGSCGLTCQNGLDNCFGTCISLASNQIEACTNADKSYTCKEGYVDHNREGFADDGTRTAEDGCEYSLNEKHVAAYMVNEEGDIELTCAADWADCNNNPDDGCETNLIAAHALSCSNEKGKIIFSCIDNYGDLNDKSEDGCEFQFDAHYATGYTRGDSNEVILQCVTNRSDCDGNYTNGCEYDLKTANAKSCDYKDGKQILTCRDGYANLNWKEEDGAADGCEVNGSNDSKHCGAQDNDPGKPCDPGYVCSGGTCAQSCGSGLNDCNGTCISFTDTNVSACSSGTITCSEGYANCDNKVSNGCEVDVKGMDAGNCGSCGKVASIKDVANSSAVTCSTGNVVATACKAGYILKSGKCEACSAGQYTISGTDTQCTTCPLTTGAEKMTSRDNICIAATCNPGYYLDGNGNCVACKPGTYSKGGETKECTSCDDGQFSGAAAASCTNCLAGTYTTNHISCGNCPAGQYSNAGAKSCTACGTDSVSAAGASACSACSAGTHANSDNTACVGCKEASQCTKGTGVNTMACTSNKCVVSKCNAGYYLENGACVACPAGTYKTTSDALGITSCTPCDAGKYSANTAQTAATACSNCGANTYSTAGAASCTTCPTGSYSAAGSSSCNLECTAASHCTKTTGANTMTCSSNVCKASKCNAGYYLDNGACVACPAGTYKTTSDALGITSCTPCDAGKYSANTAQTAATACTDCAANTYSTAGAASCTACPSGSYSAAGSPSCNLECTEASQCTKGTGVNEMACNSNKCEVSTCNAGFYLENGACIACPKGHYCTAGVTEPAACPMGKRRMTTGATSVDDCEDCPNGTYNPIDGAINCAIFPAGYVGKNSRAQYGNCSNTEECTAEYPESSSVCDGNTHLCIKDGTTSNSCVAAYNGCGGFTCEENACTTTPIP